MTEETPTRTGLCGETDTSVLSSREGAGFERQKLRGCWRRETDICVLSGTEGAGLERQTQRGCRF